MEFTEKVLVLHVGRFRERDLWVRCLAPSRGIFSAFAFGGLVSRKRFSGCLDPMNQVLLRVHRSRQDSYLSLQEGVLLSTPAHLRKDCNKIGLAANCIKFVEAVIRENETAEEAYALSVEALDALDSLEFGQAASTLFPLFFRARLAASMGFGPRLDSCSICGKPLSLAGETCRPLIFQVSCGAIACECCVSQEKQLLLPLKTETAHLLKRIQCTSPKDWVCLDPPPVIRAEAAAVIDHFVRYHLGLVWDRGTFRQL